MFSIFSPTPLYGSRNLSAKWHTLFQTRSQKTSHGPITTVGFKRHRPKSNAVAGLETCVLKLHQPQHPKLAALRCRRLSPTDYWYVKRRPETTKKSAPWVSQHATVSSAFLRGVGVKYAASNLELSGLLSFGMLRTCRLRPQTCQLASCRQGGTQRCPPFPLEVSFMDLRRHGLP